MGQKIWKEERGLLLFQNIKKVGPTFARRPKKERRGKGEQKKLSSKVENNSKLERGIRCGGKKIARRAEAEKTEKTVKIQLGLNAGLAIQDWRNNEKGGCEVFLRRYSREIEEGGRS